jgi:cytochrome c biogenesis protein CcdA
MLRRVGVMLSVGLADSLNPSTIGPALYMATAPSAARRVTEFTLGVFTVNLLAGLLLTLGPGEFLIGLVPHPGPTLKHAIEFVAGVLLVGVGVALLIGRRRLARKQLPMPSGKGGSAWITGASMAAVELPTAAPYFAVMAGLVASSASVAQQIGLLALYNVAFVLPLLAIVAVIVFGGEHADGWLQAAGTWLQRRWPVILAGVLLFIGAALTLLGGVGLVKQ